MLTNPTLCRIIAWGLLAVGGYLAIFNTLISAVVIGNRSGLDITVGASIACGLTAIELWFASWARDISHWKPLMKVFRRAPEKTILKLVAGGIGLALVYHFDIESTRLSLQGKANDAYFFLWGVAWLIAGPEIAISLNGWLNGQAKRAEAKAMKENNTRDAERQFLRTERNTLLDLSEEAGRQSAIKKVTERHGPK
ncbi:MAG: hypothetical protein AAGB19_00415 [Cyanobacteria bacterium P01_F01_bin.3]